VWGMARDGLHLSAVPAGSMAMPVSTIESERRSGVPAFVTDRVLALRYWIIAAFAIPSAVVAGGRGDWDQFAETGRQMLGRDGLHVFARARPPPRPTRSRTHR